MQQLRTERDDLVCIVTVALSASAILLIMGG